MYTNICKSYYYLRFTVSARRSRGQGDRGFSAMKKTLCILGFVSALLAFASAQSTTGTCTAEEQMQYVANELPTSCGLQLGIASANVSINDTNVLDAALDVVCRENCGGDLSNWLLGECNDQSGALGLYYWCLNTAGTASFSRCRSAIPPYFDASSSLGGAAPCFAANATNPCPAGCNLALMGLASLGCCYQSLYNNTAYLQGLVGAGSLSEMEFNALQGLSDPNLWLACQVTPPAMGCTDEGIPLPSGVSALYAHSAWTLLSVLLMAMYMLL